MGIIMGCPPPEAAAVAGIKYCNGLNGFNDNGIGVAAAANGGVPLDAAFGALIIEEGGDARCGCGGAGGVVGTAEAETIGLGNAVPKLLRSNTFVLFWKSDALLLAVLLAPPIARPLLFVLSPKRDVDCTVAAAPAPPPGVAAAVCSGVVALRFINVAVELPRLGVVGMPPAD